MRKRVFKHQDPFHNILQVLLLLLNLNTRTNFVNPFNFYLFLIQWPSKVKTDQMLSIVHDLSNI